MRFSLGTGKDFDDMAKRYSICLSKKNGGDLGCFGRGQMVPEFERTAFGLPPFAVSPVIETQFGFHIIEVLE